MDDLLIEIRKRLKYPLRVESNLDYLGFDMSGYGLGDDVRTAIGQEVCRANNFTMFVENFHDYLPSTFLLEDFKLHTWKGSVWWGGLDSNTNLVVKRLDGWGTDKICHWIIERFDIR